MFRFVLCLSLLCGGLLAIQPTETVQAAQLASPFNVGDHVIVTDPANNWFGKTGSIFSVRDNGNGTYSYFIISDSSPRYLIFATDSQLALAP